MADLLSYEEALEIVLEQVGSLGAESIELDHLLGRTLAEPIQAPIDLPPFDNSAVDGYALFLQEFNDIYHLVGEIPAGCATPMKVDPGEAARVFTGSRLPCFANAVVMQEFVTVFDKYRLLLSEQPQPGDHIRKQGEEVRTGDLVFAEGTHINPAVLGVIATLGFSEARVAKRPTIAVIGTGSELVSPGQALREGQVYESNTYGIQATLRQMGFSDVTKTRVRDDAQETERIFREALEASDILIVCGGVSVGAYDLVRPALRNLGVEERVWRVRIKPGKPFYFGTRTDAKLVFGLPGNPVSALVVFTLFVRPALKKVLGEEPHAKTLRLKTANPLKAAKGRDEFLRARILKNGTVESLEAQGSHMLSGLAAADALISVKADQPVSAGEEVEVLPLAWD